MAYNIYDCVDHDKNWNAETVLCTFVPVVHKLYMKIHNVTYEWSIWIY